MSVKLITKGMQTIVSIRTSIIICRLTVSESSTGGRGFHCPVITSITLSVIALSDVIIIIISRTIAVMSDSVRRRRAYQWGWGWPRGRYIVMDVM